MTEHMVGIGQQTRERKDDAAPERLGDASGSFPELTGNDVGLLEIDVRA